MTRAFALELAYGRAVAVAIDDADAGPPEPPEELALARQFGPARAREFLAGRRALRAALAELGGDAGVAIGRGPRGAPLLPAGWVGSVSHKRDLAAGLVTADRGWTIGLDLEARAPRPIDIARRVMTAREAAAVAALDDDARRRLVVRTFAIKEAVYKAIDPHLGRYVGFHEVALRDPRADAAIVEVPDAWGLEVEATCQAHGDHWLATARARRR
ncbi:MAG: 4'-phosphopantetheinyl transferase superfamily protein [Myxococcales bacterium]|nr:4'-phosphopantetheinyl transferase superfamily protein [Myxococcales bacterium]